MEMTILTTKCWEVHLIENQAYLGRCIVVLKRNCGDLADLKKEEITELFEIIKKLEKAIKKAFKAEMFNWTCLMNDAYKQTPPNPQVHLHLMPRYRNDINFEGKVFKDQEFAHHYNKERKEIVSEMLLNKIAEKIKQNLI